MTTTLLIARHGNTFGPNDVVTRVGGRTDLPLVESGLQQGLRLGTHLKTNGLVPDAVFTSHLARAIQTAEKAQEAMSTKLPPEKLTAFNEIDYGPDENKPETEVVTRLGEDALKAWEDNNTPPDGWKVDPAAIIQAWLDFGKRVANDYAGKRVLAVSSGGIIRFAPHLTGDFAGFRAQYKPKVSTGALCQFDFEDGKWVCKNWNVKPA